MTPISTPLWATLHRYDATKGYDSASDGLLHGMGLPPLGTAQTGQLPASVTPAQSPIAASVISVGPPSYIPERLWDLDFRGMYLPDGTEIILPPLCDVPAGPFLMGSDPKKDA